MEEKTMKTKYLMATAAIGLAMSASTALAQELRFTCYSDGNECEVYDDLISRFEAEHDGVDVKIDVVPYQAILDNLPVQLAAGKGPDLAKVTDLGGLNKYYLDLAPYVDRAYWEASFGDTLNWYRAGPDDDGIYGMHSQLTITGPYVNATLFEQAGVEMPGAGATWEEWAKAAREVTEKTDADFPMAIDRSGHRVAGPAISYGAKLFDADGNGMLDDEGFRAYAKQFVEWNNDGTMLKDVWVGQGGASHGDAAQEFINGELVFYYSGSWNAGRMDSQIGDFFDWRAVGSPCGPAGACSGMPGGAGIVAFKQTEHPELVAKLIDFLAKEEVYAEAAARTRNLPAHLAVAKKGVKYENASEAAQNALTAFAGDLANVSPIAFRYQGYAGNRAMFGITVERLSQAVAGELSVDEAMDRMASDLKAAQAETK